MAQDKRTGKKDAKIIAKIKCLVKAKRERRKKESQQLLQEKKEKKKRK